MKTSSRKGLGRGCAFTLPELLVTLAMMMLVVGAAMAAYIYGLRMVQFTKPKLGASDEARKTVGLLTDDIRSAHRVKLGIRTNGTFVPLPAFATQVASALRVQPNINTNQFILYYWDGATETVKRTTDGSAGVVVASAVTNEFVFSGEDYRGFPHTNHNASLVIGITLRFNQIQFPKMAVGPGNYYDFYQLRVRINKRAYF